MTLPILQFRINRPCCKTNKLKENGTLLIPSNDRPNTNGAVRNSHHFNGPAFKARPLKHYRKRLMPYNQVKSSNIKTIHFDRPGSTSYNNEASYNHQQGMVMFNEKI